MADMAQDEMEKLLNMYEDGSGFGDPEARRNAEQRLQGNYSPGLDPTDRL
jgi:hypothetical protein